MPRHDNGTHNCLSEDWLIENLPQGWTYDCQCFTAQDGFLIFAPGMSIMDDIDVRNALFIPLDLLRKDRNDNAN